MSQILHVFRKDVRHLWIEISASLAVLAAYTWQTVAYWGKPEPVGFLGVLSKALMVLVPISWCLLMIRSIQDESLVGDRQFWITRPYDWKQLAGAKLLLAVVFVHIPLFVAQVIMLNQLGFSAIHYLKGLLWIQLLILVALVLPAAVAAVVTSSIVQVLIGIVIVVLYGVGVAGLSSLTPSSDVPTSSAASDYWSAGAFGALALLVILMQFGWRKTWASRLVIAAAGLVLIVIGLATPYATIISRAYPPPGPSKRVPVRIDIRAQEPKGPKSEETPSDVKKVNVTFPMQASEVADGTVARVVGTLVTIQVRGGRTWSSKWQAGSWVYWPGDYDSSLPVEVDRKFFDQNRDKPVNVHFSFAITGYRETNTREVTAQPGKFPIPGVGTCWVGLNGYGGQDWVGCHVPLKEPSFTGRLDSSASTCTPGPDDDANLHESLHAWNPRDDSDPAELGIVPVKYFYFYFSEQREANRKKSPLGICPGTQFTIARPNVFQQVRTEAELDGVKLSDYLAPRYPFSIR